MHLCKHLYGWHGHYCSVLNSMTDKMPAILKHPLSKLHVVRGSLIHQGIVEPLEEVHINVSEDSTHKCCADVLPLRQSIDTEVHNVQFAHVRQFDFNFR